MTNGIKISKPTKDIKTAVLKDLLFHSDYAMFKYHLDTTASMTINAGDTTKLITIPHGLSYVPAFISYIKYSDGLMMLPQRRQLISGIDEQWYAYADATNIYIGWKSAQPYNKTTYSVSDYWNSFIFSNSSFEVGNDKGSGVNGSMRFTSIDLNNSQSIVSATVDVYVGAKGTGSGNLLHKIYGIDEDNTSDYSSDPTSREKTSAVTEQNVSIPPSGEIFGVNVTNQVSEIISRTGWSNGNALGFNFFDNGSNTDVWVYNGSSKRSTLSIIKSGSTSYSFRIIVFKDKIHS